jgi:hypothetical protein
MLIDVIVGSAIVLFGAYLYWWASSATLRERIERPKHVFLQQVNDLPDHSGERK